MEELLQIEVDEVLDIFKKCLKDDSIEIRQDEKWPTSTSIKIKADKYLFTLVIRRGSISYIEKIEDIETGVSTEACYMSFEMILIFASMDHGLYSDLLAKLKSL